MKKIILIIASVALIHTMLLAQGCLPEGIIFETQEQIDNFQINYPGCTEIEGDVNIEGSEITNLNGLSVLTSIEGNLILGVYYDVNGPTIESLSGLDNLSSVGGDFAVFGCGDLLTLSGIENLTSVGGNLNIGIITDQIWCYEAPLSNENLNTISSLSGLTSIGGDLEIVGNESLTNLSGLENVTSVGGNVSIASTHLTSLEGLQGLSNTIDNLQIGAGIFNWNAGIENYYEGGNYNLTSLSGLENLTLIGGDIYICGNEMLPNLSGLPDFTSLNGSLNITDNDALTDFTDLENLTTISGNFKIAANDGIISLIGLDNLSSIGGYLSIGGHINYEGGNPNLTSLTGLEGLTSIGGYLQVYDNNVLTSLTGLDNMTSIGGYLEVCCNDALTSLTGLDNLTSIGGLLRITGNDALTSLTGLDNMTSIGGYLEVTYNDTLTSLTGLGNIESGSISNILINENNLLSTCDVQSICDFLEACPNGAAYIYNNAPGCNYLWEVEEACEAHYCLPEGITFTTQEQIDSFQINYPNCSEIEGDVEINGLDITNLNGLNVLTSIGGHLWISSNNNLIDLAGLENITSIGGNLSLSQNESLISLNALYNVTHIGESLGIFNNPVLSTLSGLEGIASVGGDISISYNDALNNLLGLQNITSAGGLTIQATHLNSLMGLNNLDSIAGNVAISYNNSLNNLSGLDNLAYIGGDLIICINGALTSYTGLEQLITIAGGLFIGDCFNSPPFYDTSLTSIAAFDSLTNVGRLFIKNNMVLTSLAGLDNVDANSVQEIFIYNNWNLSECEVQSVCDYLANPNGTIDIYNNAPGCNNPEEVEEACFSSLNEIPGQINFSIFPNPFNDQAFLSIDTQSKSLLWVYIYNITGICVKSWQFQNQQPGEKEYVLDLKDLPAGIYFCRVQDGNEMVTQKLIKY